MFRWHKPRKPILREMAGGIGTNAMRPYWAYLTLMLVAALMAPPPAALADASNTVAVRVGDVVLHVPTAYVDGSDGFQGKFGYLKIRAELPCLTPLTGEDPRMQGKGWGNIVIAQLSALGPSERIGEALLEVVRQENEAASKWHFRNKDHASDEQLIYGTKFQLFEDNMLGADYFYPKNSPDTFLLRCRRHSDFPSPDCSSRSVVNGTLLLEYHYSRSFIDQSIEDGLHIDQKLHLLLEKFLSNKPELFGLTDGICK